MEGNICRQTRNTYHYGCRSNALPSFARYTRDPEELKNNEDAIIAKEHSIKWSDDVMDRDKEFRNFVVQTLRMYSLYSQYFNGKEWVFDNPQSKKIYDILIKYDNKGSESPDSKKYKKLLKKWILWDAMVDEKIKK
jgi:hypothetical protein